MECHNDFKVDVCHIEVHADKYVTACMNSRHHSEINGGAFVNVLTFVNYIICVMRTSLLFFSLFTSDNFSKVN